MFIHKYIHAHQSEFTVGSICVFGSTAVFVVRLLDSIQTLFVWLRSILFHLQESLFESAACVHNTAVCAAGYFGLMEFDKIETAMRGL